MEYCGEPISTRNAPEDWRQQITTILSALRDADCHHGDLSEQNILVHEGKLKFIDFATACSWQANALTKKRTYADAEFRRAAKGRGLGGRVGRQRD